MNPEPAGPQSEFSDITAAWHDYRKSWSPVTLIRDINQDDWPTTLVRCAKRAIVPPKYSDHSVMIRVDQLLLVRVVGWPTTAHAAGTSGFLI